MTLGVRRQVKTCEFGDVEMSKYVDVGPACASILNMGLLNWKFTAAPRRA